MRNALLGIFLCLFASTANADDNFEAVKLQLIADNPTVDLSEISYENNTLDLNGFEVSDISALSGLTTLTQAITRAKVRLEKRRFYGRGIEHL